ncbi:MAG: glycosyltransferase family 39 protein [Anaerolineae bacterium]|nr:glycosyltransferase family 39 protein [Anaerolineae bacterium]
MAITLLVYLPFQSISLDDFDSYNFARALIRFDPESWTPHPPGYVLYIWVGRLVLRFTGDPHTALTLLSAISAALACGILFRMTRTLFGIRSALYAVLLVGFTPLMWLNANKALSDMPGLLAQAWCMERLVAALHPRRSPALAALLIGVAAGFRPQGAMGPMLALLMVLFWMKARIREWLISGLALAAGALTWLLPLLHAFHWRLDTWFRYLVSALGFVMTRESSFAVALNPSTFDLRGQELWVWSSQAVLGPGPAWLRTLLAVAMALLILTACIRERKAVGTWLSLIWLGSHLGFHVFFLDPSQTRYLLSFFFPMAILTAAGMQVFPRWVGLLVLLGWMVLLQHFALPLAQQLHTVPAPPDQLAAYLAQRWGPADTMVIARQSYNALQYHLPGWDVRFADYYGDERLLEEITSRKPARVVIADPEALRPGDEYVEIETRIFARNPQVHAKHARVEVSIYGRVDTLTPRDFTIPEDHTVRIGTPQDGKYILEGWYRREEMGGVPARWTGAEISATLRVWLPQEVRGFTFTAWSFASGQSLEILCNGESLGTYPVPQQWAEIEVLLSEACRLPDRVTYIHFRPALRVSPAGAGQSTDRRTLGVAISWIRFWP